MDTRQHVCYSNLFPRALNSILLLIISKVLSSAVKPLHWLSSAGKNSPAGVQHLSALMSASSLCSRISGFDPPVIIAKRSVLEFTVVSGIYLMLVVRA